MDEYSGKDSGDIEVSDLAPIVTQNHEDEKNPRCRCRYRKEIKGNKFIYMIVQKCPRCLGGRSRAPDHILGNNGFG